MKHWTTYGSCSRCRSCCFQSHEIRASEQNVHQLHEMYKCCKNDFMQTFGVVKQVVNDWNKSYECFIGSIFHFTDLFCCILFCSNKHSLLLTHYKCVCPVFFQDFWTIIRPIYRSLPAIFKLLRISVKSLSFPTFSALFSRNHRFMMSLDVTLHRIYE